MGTVDPWEPVPNSTPFDLSGLKVKGVVSRAQLNRLEIENIAKAIAKYLLARPVQRVAPFDVRWLKRLHREMFGDVWKWAGQFRTMQTNIGVRPYEIEPRLHDAMADLAARGDAQPLDTSVWLHHGVVSIHPFTNGNGRWSRLVTNIWLRRCGSPIIRWPDTLGETSPIRTEYIAAIVAADNHDFAPLAALHKRFTAT